MEKADKWVFVARKVAFWAACRRPYCSECLGDALATALVDEVGDYVRTPFCPWCGAQMENPDEEAKDED